MIVFPKTAAEAAAAEGSYRAGGTDLHERRRLGLQSGDLVDLRDVAELRNFERAADGGFNLGARLRISTLAERAELREGYPALAEAAGGLATPQVRAVATLGGNLLQATRCWYYRSPDADCVKRGGSGCPAREGDHLFHSCFDPGPCPSVHASTLGMTLLAYEAWVAISGSTPRSIADLYGDGSNPKADHELEANALLTHVVLPPPLGSERSAYFRATSRERAEWPLVEAAVRLVTDGKTISFARVAVGGVAPRPLRLPAVEAALVGAKTDEASLRAACEPAIRGASPLPMTAYKVDLLPVTILETLERALGREPVTAAAPPVSPAPKPDAPATADDAKETP